MALPCTTDREREVFAALIEDAAPDVREKLRVLLPDEPAPVETEPVEKAPPALEALIAEQALDADGLQRHGSRREVNVTTLEGRSGRPRGMLSLLDGHPDPRPPVEDLAAADEQLEAEASASIDRWLAGTAKARPVARSFGTPKPRLILGVNASWPVLWSPATGEPCPVCRGRRLAATTYCLACDASGLDAMLATSERAEKYRREHAGSMPAARPEPRPSKPKAGSVAAPGRKPAPAPGELVGGLGSPAAPRVNPFAVLDALRARKRKRATR